MYYSRVDRGADRAGHGSGDDNGESLSAARRDHQNVLGPQTDVFRLPGENPLDVHGDLLVFQRVRRRAEDLGSVLLGGAPQPAGQGEGAEDGNGALAAQVESAGALHVADHVNHAGVALGDRNHVMGLDFDVGGGVLAVHYFLHVELGAAVTAGGVGAGAGQGDGAVLRQSDDGNGGTRGFARAAGHGKDFVERLPATELEDAWGADGAEDRDGLAAELGYGDRDLWLLHVGFSAQSAPRAELLDGKAGGFDPPDHRQRDVAVGSDEDGLVARIEAVERPDYDLVVGAEDIARGHEFDAFRLGPAIQIGRAHV